MRIAFEQDSWFWEELGFEGLAWWGDFSRRRSIALRLRYPDKTAHLLGAMFLTWLLAHSMPPGSAGAIAFLMLWLGLEVRPSRDLLWLGSWRDTLADAVGAAFAIWRLRG